MGLEDWAHPLDTSISETVDPVSGLRNTTVKTSGVSSSTKSASSSMLIVALANESQDSPVFLDRSDSLQTALDGLGWDGGQGGREA